MIFWWKPELLATVDLKHRNKRNKKSRAKDGKYENVMFIHFKLTNHLNTCR